MRVLTVPALRRSIPAISDIPYPSCSAAHRQTQFLRQAQHRPAQFRIARRGRGALRQIFAQHLAAPLPALIPADVDQDSDHPGLHIPLVPKAPALFPGAANGFRHGVPRSAADASIVELTR
jgi:hypothetical protein